MFLKRDMRSIALAAAVALLSVDIARATPLDPMAFTSTTSLSFFAGTATIDSSNTPTLKFGARTYTGTVVAQGNGLPDIAVFVFDSLHMNDGTGITVTGTRPVALLSQSDITLNANAFITVVPGGGGGVDSASGPGGGGTNHSGGGGGGGFGGSGGHDGTVSVGGPYGDLLVGLQGGSGGGISPSLNLAGGSGGGTLELGAVTSINLAATAVIKAAGSPGTGGGRTDGSGGGSGGGVLLHAPSVAASSGTTINAAGAAGGAGAGPITTAFGSGGGGGRINVVISDYTAGSATLPTTLVTAGASANPYAAQAGVSLLSVGTLTVPASTIYDFTAPGFNQHTAATHVIANANAILAYAGTYQPIGDVSLAAGSTLSATNGVVGGGWLLAGATVNATTGFTTDITTAVRGVGTINAPILSGSNNPIKAQITADSGTLTIGDATRNDGVSYAGTLTLTGPAATPGTLVLLDANRADIGNVQLNSVNGSLRADRGITFAENAKVSASVESTINGVVTAPASATFAGPSGPGGYLNFANDVDGSARLSGNIRFRQHYAPGGIGTTAGIAATTVAFDATATLQIDLAGPNAAQYDSLSDQNTIVAGTLALSTLNGYVPPYGVQAAIIQTSQRTGMFATVTGNQVAPDRWLAVTYTSSRVSVTAALPGDADLSKTVDFNDLLALAKTYGQTSGGTWATGDFDGNGAVNFDDLLALAKFYNKSSLTGAAEATLPTSIAADWTLARSLVPEPGAMTLSLVAAGIGVRRPRRPVPG